MAEGRQPRRVGEIGACGEALSKYERNQEQFDGNAYVMPCARCLPPSRLPTTLLCLALDWTHVGQSGLPLAVKLFNWSLIGCDCSALGGTARCRACFLTLQAKVMIPAAAPTPAPALPFFLLFAGRSHFIFCFAPSAKWNLAFHSPPAPNPLASHLTSTTNERSPFSLAALRPSLSLSPLPFPLPLLSWCCAALIAH